VTITRHAVGATMTLPTFYAPVSLSPVYSDGFQAGVGGWAVAVGGTALTQVLNPTTGAYEMRSVWAWNGVSVQHYGSASHVVTPVTSGKVYQVVANVRAPGRAQARVSASPGTVISGGGWVTATPYATPVSLLVQATSSSLTVFLDSADVAFATDAATVYWQDVAVYEMAATTALDLHPEAARITLDESWSPYAVASITCPIPPTDALAKIDPRVMNRVRLLLTQADVESRTAAYLTTTYAGKTAAYLTTTYAGKTAAWLSDLFGDQYNATIDLSRNQRRTMDLMLRTRTLDYVSGTMTLELTSDEMLLQDFARPESSTSMFTPPGTTSMRALVNWGLKFINATLEPGPADALIDPATFIWNLGEQLWSFLDAFIRTNNLRLWCDEQRRWYLTPPQTGASGTANIGAVTQLRDTLSRDDDGYGDATVIVYQWVDGAGLTQRAYGNYYLSTMQYPKMFVQRFDSPNTGVTGSPASALRDRTITRGRAVGLDAVSDYRVTPGQAAVVATPVATVTGAMVSAVTWQWPDDEMTIRTRDAS
jgi:hypothetical protein